MNCGKCASACPSNCMDANDPRPKTECLSAITQKKGELSEDEKNLILENGSAWGCDICQKICPHTQRAIKNRSIYSPVPFFNENRTPFLTYEAIEGMSDEEFGKRAYSWRGKAVLLRNLKLLESSDK